MNDTTETTTSKQEKAPTGTGDAFTKRLISGANAYEERTGRPDYAPARYMDFVDGVVSFAEWAGARLAGSTIADVAPETVRGFVEYLESESTPAGTINQRIGALRFLFDVSKEEGRPAGNPWEQVIPRPVIRTSGAADRI